MRRCYQSWSLRKMEEEKPYSFDMFLDEILAEIKKEEAAQDEEEHAEWWQEEIQEMEEEEEKSEEKSGEEPTADPEPSAPFYKDGMLSDEWFDFHWEKFRRCQECKKWRYVSKTNGLRHRQCRGCFTPGCKGQRKHGQAFLLKKLVENYGWVPLQSQIEKIYMDKVDEEI